MPTEGPREENPATSGTGVASAGVVVEKVAVPPPAMAYVRTAPAVSLRWMVGTTWKSGSSDPGITFTSNMPTPPAALTARDLSVRAYVPRSHWTIFPVTFAGSSVPGAHSRTALGSAPARPTLTEATSGVFAGGSVVAIEVPMKESPLPNVTLRSATRKVLAATVVIQGLGWS